MNYHKRLQMIKNRSGNNRNTAAGHDVQNVMISDDNGTKYEIQSGQLTSIEKGPDQIKGTCPAVQHFFPTS